jgi:hypothetical protein
MGAAAFACGPNILFAPGKYDLGSPCGQQLLAHELTHVLQQRAGRVRYPAGNRWTIVRDAALEAEAVRAALAAPFVAGISGQEMMEGRFQPDDRACIQLAAAPGGPGPGGVAPPATTWAKVNQFMTSPPILGLVGTVGIGLLAYQHRDQLLTLAADAAAAVGTRLFTPEQAGDFVINRVVNRMLEAEETGVDYAIQVTSGYASLVMPYGGLIATPVGYAINALWTGISPMQDFAIRVFRALPDDWRNRFLGNLALGMPKVVAAMGVNWVNRLASAVELVATTSSQWG